MAIARPDDQSVLERLTQVALRSVHVGYAALHPTLPREAFPVIRCARGELEAIQPQTDFEELLCRRILAADHSFVLRDVAEDPALLSLLPEGQPRIRSCVGVVLEDPVGARVGVLYVGESAPREWTSNELQLLRDIAGLAAGELASSIDHARHRQEAERLRRLVESSPYPTYAVDVEGRITELNGAAGELLGIDPEKAIGRHFTEFIDPEDIDEAQRAFAARISGEVPTPATELRLVTAKGDRRLVSSHSFAIRVGNETVGIHGIARDVTEERAREGQLRRAERLSSLSTLLSGVAHELNNPLTSIKSFSQLMLLDDRPPEDVESLEVIHREADRAAKIVTDLRLMTRQSYGDETNRSVFDLNEIVGTVVVLARFSIGAAGIDLREDLARDALPVYGHRAQLEQMVLNLVLNAEHAVRDQEGERRIIIRTRQSRRGIALAIIDSGRGISPEHLDRIFDPFWTTRSPGQGTGLGLSVVHSIVKEHGGEVRVESEIGKGSAFTVDLPWPMKGIEPAAIPRSARDTSVRLRILIVDDEAPIRLSLARFLERRGHDVADAEDGRRALELLDQHGPYDLIVSDLRMPGLGGVQLFERLLGRGDGSERRVVFITGDAAGSETDGFLHGTGVPVILKPFALADVADTLERHADRLIDGAFERGM